MYGKIGLTVYLSFLLIDTGIGYRLNSFMKKNRKAYKKQVVEIYLQILTTYLLV